VKRKLQNACPAMPEAFHRHILNTIDQLEDRRMAGRRKFSAALIAALVGALLIAGLAYAATQSGLLDSLFPGKEPTQTARELLAQPGLGAEYGGVRLTVDEYLLEENSLHMRVTFTSDLDETLLCAVEAPRVGGHKIWTGGLDAFRALRKGEPVQIELDDTRFDFDLDTASPVEIAFTGYVLRPLTDLSWSRPGAGAPSDPAADSFAEPYEPDRYELMSDEAAKLYEPGGTMSPVDVYEKLGYTETVAALPISIAVQPESLQKGGSAKPDGQTTFEFDAYTLAVDQLELGPASTNVRLYLYPKAPLTEEDLGWDSTNPLIYRSYRLLGPDGKDLLKDVTGGSSSGFDYEAEARGDPQRIVYIGSWGPVAAIPDSVTLMPCPHDKLEVPENYLTDEAVTVRVK